MLMSMFILHSYLMQNLASCEYDVIDKSL